MRKIALSQTEPITIPEISLKRTAGKKMGKIVTSGAGKTIGKISTKTAVAGVTAANADERIYDSIFTAVMSQRLQPGTKLTENSLCELFGVSRTTVRKVLQRLAHENIVELRPNHGATVASPSPEETAEVFAARRIVEAAIIPLVIKNATRAQLTRLVQHAKNEHKILAEGDRSSWIRMTGEFHLILADIAGNRVLTRFLSELVSRCSLIIALYDAPNSVPCTNDEHEELVELIAAKNAVRALELMDHHLLEIEGRLNLAGERSVDLAEILKIT